MFTGEKAGQFIDTRTRTRGIAQALGMRKRNFVLYLLWKKIAYCDIG